MYDAKEQNQNQKTSIVDEDSPKILQMNAGHRGILVIILLQCFEHLELRFDRRFQIFVNTPQLIRVQTILQRLVDPV